MLLQCVSAVTWLPGAHCHMAHPNDTASSCLQTQLKAACAGWSAGACIHLLESWLILVACLTPQMRSKTPLRSCPKPIWHPAGALQVLDLAGGSGWPAIPLAKAFPDVHVTCTGTCSRSRSDTP